MSIKELHEFTKLYPLRVVVRGGKLAGFMKEEASP